MSMNLIAIGVDQSKQATGLCMYQFDLKGRYKFMRSATVETQNYTAMRDAILTFVGLNTPTVVMAEDGFKGCNVATTITAAWVEAVVYQYHLGEFFDKVAASRWRATVWPGTGMKKSDAWKAYSIKMAIKEGIKNPDDHQGDASGIARYAITAYLKHLEERIDD